jgi:thioredoxin reductase (NADPH)
LRESDVVVLGAGLAGLTASMIAAQHGLSVILVEQMGPGGQVLNVDRIENMPGFPDGIPGYELGPLVQAQAEAAGCEFAFDIAIGLSVDGDWRVLRCAEEDLAGHAMIIAAGSSFRNLGIPGEDRFEGKGVSHCASCDGSFFVGKTVAVVGGGDSAIEEAAVLAKFAAKVLVFSQDSALHAQQYLVDAANGSGSIEVRHDSHIEEILGEEVVTGVRMQDLTSRSTRVEAVDGVFVYVGLEPNTALLKDVVALDAGGHIITDAAMATSCPGVFAAGDIRQGSVSLVASAIGDGATAAVSACRYVRGRNQ